MSEDLKYGLQLAATFAVIFALVTGLLYWGLTTKCQRIGTQVERTTEFYMFGGCFVELTDGRSVPIDENSIGLFLEER